MLLMFIFAEVIKFINLFIRLKINGNKMAEIIKEKFSLCKVDIFKINIKIKNLNPEVLLIFGVYQILF